MDRQAFRNRMQQLKQYREQNPGKTYLDWKQQLPENLQDESSYNLKRAYELGYEPEVVEGDSLKHLPTRDQETGEILKKPWHPTFLIGLLEDARLGYYPQIIDGTTYTTTWEGNENPIYKYADGGEIPPNNKPIIPEEPQPYKGKLYKDRYGRKYTEDQLADYYDNSSDEIDRFTGKPFVRGLKPVGDIEDAANATPVGDAISAYDTYKALKNKDWEGAGLAAMGLIPFMPMTVKQFRSKYKGITPKQKYKAVSHDYNTSVNRNYVQDRIDEALAYDAAVNSKLTQAKNQTYNVVERLMDDPSYIERAKQVKTQFGDDYIQAYADIINLYNENPLELPNVERLNSGNSRARMQRNSNGTYSYKLDPDIADISAPVTEHELSHYADFKRNLDRPDPHGDSNMFYQMKKDISGRKIDSRDDYYSLPTEQKAHMNQLREYMFQNNYISTREETVDEKLLKKAIQEADKLDSMRGVARASRQFKSFNKYTKWFNSIPLLSIGAAAVYNNNQEK